MSKSILIIDTPNSCSKCPIKSQLYDIHYICCVNHRRIIIPGKEDKPDWCPLKEIQEKKIYDSLSEGNPVKAWGNGWNACLDEILNGDQ